MIESISILCYFLFPVWFFWWLHGIRKELSIIFRWELVLVIALFTVTLLIINLVSLY